MARMDADTRRAKRLETKRVMRPLRIKRRRGETLTPQEQDLWDRCIRTLNRLGGTPKGGWIQEDKPYDSKSGASNRSGGPSTRQGPAQGVTSVVRGGLPTLGKKR